MKSDRMSEISMRCLKLDLEMWRKYVSGKELESAISCSHRIDGKLELIMLLGIMDFEEYWEIKEMINGLDLSEEKWNKIIARIDLSL